MSKSIRFRTKYSPRRSVSLSFGADEGRTKQEFLADCDLNRIVERYRRTGVLPESVRANAMRFGDFSSLPTLAEAQEKIHVANELFLALPSRVRDRYNNDPAAFFADSQTPEGRELFVTLGIASHVKPAPSPADPVSAGGQPAPKVE